MRNSKTSLAIAGLLCAAVSSTVVGCGQGAPPTVVQAPQAQIDNAVKMREFFVKANGNYASLSAEDQQAYNKLAGGAEAGQAQWKTMSKNPSTGPTPGNADPRAGMAGSPGGG